MRGYLQGQIGNPEGEDKPNKSCSSVKLGGFGCGISFRGWASCCDLGSGFYDPRKWIRECESSMVKRVKDLVATSLKPQNLLSILP